MLLCQVSSETKKHHDGLFLEDVYVGNVVHCWSKRCFPCLFSLSLSTVWLDISVFPISVTFFITWYWNLYIPSILKLSYSSCLYFYRRYAYRPFLELEVVAQKELKITELHIANFVHNAACIWEFSIICQSMSLRFIHRCSNSDRRYFTLPRNWTAHQKIELWI